MGRQRIAHTRAARRALHAGLAVGIVVLTVSASPACLVTQEVSYEAPDSTPQLKRVHPLEDIVRVPQAPNSLCPGDGFRMRFEVEVADRDTQQELFYRLFINGVPTDKTGNLPAREDGAEVRTMREPPCLTYEELTREPCNRVTLLVSGDFPTLNRRLMLNEFDFSSASVTWSVLRGSLTGPDVSVADCTPAEDDAGTGP